MPKNYQSVESIFANTKDHDDDGMKPCLKYLSFASKPSEISLKSSIRKVK